MNFADFCILIHFAWWKWCFAAANKTRALLQSKKAAANLIPESGYPPVVISPLTSRGLALFIRWFCHTAKIPCANTVRFSCIEIPNGLGPTSATDPSVQLDLSSGLSGNRSRQLAFLYNISDNCWRCFYLVSWTKTQCESLRNCTLEILWHTYLLTDLILLF